MVAQRTCPECGTRFGPDAPEGACPACALRSALDAGRGDGEVSELGTAGGPLRQDRPLEGQRFGDYELLGEIARGGMGVVYRARQLSLNRLVALKMILAGRLASTAEVKRFQVEAETAAKLHHPNILAIHEVGVQDGQHYFSMELVEGRDLAALVREHPLPARQAARYTKAIAEAVHYAHEHGVLHRDLKPSNVLIDQSDEPRITDFGLARQLEDDSEVTRSGQVLGSPNFMPPEQAAGRRREVGRRSDIYSVGALLYHLVTGRPPFVAETVQATLAAVAQSEPLAPRALNARVPRDLQTICLKCLEKSPARRYGTAKELAEELERFINGEPVLARPVRVPERVWRWCRRNPAFATMLALSGFLALLITFGSLGAAWWLSRAHEAEKRARLRAVAAENAARAEAQRSREVARFLQDMLYAVGPSVAQGRDTRLLREVLEETNKRLESELQDQPQVEADLHNVLGRVYAELGDFRAAEVSQRRALALESQVRPVDPAKGAAILSDLADALGREGEYLEAEMLTREVVVRQMDLHGQVHGEVALALNNLGNILWRQGNMPAAEPIYCAALGVYRQLPNADQGKLAGVLGNLGNLYGAEGRPAEAEPMFRQALSVQEQVYGPEHPIVAKTLSNLANSVLGQGRLDEAEVLFGQAVALRRKILGEAHPDLAISLHNLARVFEGQGKLAQAEATEAEALAMRRNLLGEEHPDTVLSLRSLAGILSAEGEAARAEGMAREALDIRRRHPGYQNQDLAQSLHDLAMVLAQEQQLAEAEALEREAMAALQPFGGVNHPYYPIAHDYLIKLLEREGKASEAESLRQESVESKGPMRGSVPVSK